MSADLPTPKSFPLACQAGRVGGYMEGSCWQLLGDLVLDGGCVERGAGDLAACRPQALPATPLQAHLARAHE